MCDRRTFLCLAGTSLATCLLAGCGPSKRQADSSASGKRKKRGLERVVAVSRSWGEMVLLAGGELVGITDDGFDLSGISAKVASIGTPDKPSAEQVMACNPELVLLTEAIPAQRALREQLEAAGVACRNMVVNSFEEYARYMTEFCDATGRSDLYQTNVGKVSDGIDKIVASAQGLPEETYLALSVSVTKSVALKSGHFACRIFDDLRLRNVADDSSTLDELTIKAISAADPAYVFVIPQGDPDEARKAFEQVFSSRPGWKELTAAMAGRVYHMPQDLFYYRPNARWAEAYQYALEHRVAK